MHVTLFAGTKKYQKNIDMKQKWRGMNTEDYNGWLHHPHDDQDYYCCSTHCPEKFRENSDTYIGDDAGRDGAGNEGLAHAETAGARIYTCPMHPEVVRDTPGSCPQCGVALSRFEQAARVSLWGVVVPVAAAG